MESGDAVETQNASMRAKNSIRAVSHPYESREERQRLNHWQFTQFYRCAPDRFGIKAADISPDCVRASQPGGVPQNRTMTVID